MGSKSPTASYFCTRPLFTIYAHLWAYVGRRTGRYVEPGYEHLSECPGYSVWYEYYQRSNGSFPLRTRLSWTWRDVKKVFKLASRWLRISLRSAISGA